MNGGGHIQPGRWPLLLSLDRQDPERGAAMVHADSCRDCDAERRAGLALLDELSSLPSPQPPGPEVLRRAAAGVQQALAEDSSAQGRASWIEGLAAAGAFGALVGLVHPSATGAWAPALALLGAALLIPWAVKWSGRWGLALVGLSVPFAAFRALGHRFTFDVGGNCVLWEALAAALPLAALVWMVRRRGAGFGAAAFAGAAAAGALAGQAALLLICPSRDLGHLMIAHSGTVVLAALLGAAVPRLVPALTRTGAGH